jgi:MFS family permease
MFLVIGGRLGDRYGKRRLYLIGIAGFVTASLICGLAVDPAMIVAGRLMQGAFGALLIPQGIRILIASFSQEQLPRAFGAFGPVLGPVVGGFIISADLAGLHWRPVFLVNIVFGTAGLIAAVLLPDDQPVSGEPIDGLGSGLLWLMMLAFIYGLIQGSANGWTAIPIASLAAGAVLFAALADRQRRATSPLIKPTLLLNKGFTSGPVLGLSFFAALAGLTYLISLFSSSSSTTARTKRRSRRRRWRSASSPRPSPAGRWFSGWAGRWSSSAWPQRWPGRSACGPRCWPREPVSPRT